MFERRFGDWGRFLTLRSRNEVDQGDLFDHSLGKFADVGLVRGDVVVMVL